MRRICGLSSHTRNRSLLKSIRNIAGPRGRTADNGIPGVNHIAAPLTNGCGDRQGRVEIGDQYPNCSLKMRSSRLWPGSNSIRLAMVLSDSTCLLYTSDAADE